MMKRLVKVMIFAGALWVSTACTGFSQEASRKVVGIVTTEELLKQRQNHPQAEVKKDWVKVEGQADPSTRQPVRDIISQSDILSYAGYTTLVPKRAIIHRPAEYQSRYEFVKGSKVVSWLEFYRLNRGWISVVEVSREQAEGKVPLSEETRGMLEKSTNLVVAVYQGGPISLLPPVKPPPPANPAETPSP
ncbi:MAG: hypothetical protein QM680_14410 [Luteolibacter sp.]